MYLVCKPTLVFVFTGVLSSIVQSSEIPSFVEAARSQITDPPSLSVEIIGKRTATAVTCSEWSVQSNGLSSYFTCPGGVNTCILGASTPYWHCGIPEAEPTWYSSCYDFPASFHSGNNNYCQENRPYCATWSIISDHHTFSTFGCDTTKSGDKTLVRMPSATSPGSPTGTSNAAGLSGENGGNQAHANSSPHLKVTAAVTGTLLGLVCSAAVASGIWWIVAKRNGKESLGVLDIKERSGVDSVSSQEKPPVIQVVEIKGKDT